jgi:hypothetical protein
MQQYFVRCVLFERLNLITLVVMSETKDKMQQVENREEARPPSENTRRSDNDEEKNLSVWTAIRRDPKVTAYSFAVTLGILLWGFDLVIVGTVSSIPAFQ